MQKISGGVEALERALAVGARAGCPPSACGAAAGAGGSLLTLRDPATAAEALPGASDATRALDVAVVGALVLDRALGLDAGAVAVTDRIRYRRRAADAADLVAAEPEGTAVALLLRAPTVAEVEAVAAAGETMPQKSTFFFPKLLDGLVFHPLRRLVSADTMPPVNAPTQDAIREAMRGVHRSRAAPQRRRARHGRRASTSTAGTCT